MDLQPAIFDAKWPLVVWMRIEEFQLVSLKMISEAPYRLRVVSPTHLLRSAHPPLPTQALLLKTPTYAAYTSLPLTVPGELQGRNLGFARQVVLWASNANKGARAMANELATAFTGVIVCGGAEIPPRATHMLLYLCEATWSDDRLAEQVERVREAGLPIVMAHENDPDRDGCAFARFFETTPQELVASGIYRDLAIACFPGLHRQERVPRLSQPRRQQTVDDCLDMVGVAFALGKGSRCQPESRS